MHRLCCLLLIAGAVLWLSAARAANVAILQPASDAPGFDEALFRLKGELLAVGVLVSLTERPPEVEPSASRAWLERTADERAIDAFIDLVGESAPVAVDIWLWQRAPRRLRATRVALDADAENAAATLAIRAIEVLRSSLIASDLTRPGEVRSPAQPLPAHSATVPTTPRHVGARFGLSVGATALTSLDGVGPMFLPLVRLDWQLRTALAIQGTAAGFGTRPRVETAAGSVEVAQQFALFGVCLCMAIAPRIHATAAISLGALHTALAGQARAPNSGHDVQRWALLTEASAGVQLRLFGDWYVTPAAHIQLAEPYIAIHSVDTTAATTGRPNLRFSLTAGAWL